MAVTHFCVVLAACLLGFSSAVALRKSVVAEIPPQPPCYVPWVGKTFEAPCTTPLYTNNSISVLQYGLPAASTLVVGSAGPDVTVYQEAFNLGAYEVFTYLGGFNNASLNLLKARTVPLVLRKPSAGTRNQWLIAMMVATSQFPNPHTLPAPKKAGGVPLVNLTAFGSRLLAVKHVHSTFSPQPSDLDAACEELLASIPAGFVRVSATSPSNAWPIAHAYYNTQDSLGPYDYECWTEVTKQG